MKKILTFISILATSVAMAASGLEATNEVLTVNQDGKISDSGVATIEAIATNAVLVQIAMQKAEIAAQTAIDTTNAIQAIVDNIMSNRVIIYRRGFVDSFAALTIITDVDTCHIIQADWIETSTERLLVDVYYCCSADVSQIKPNVYTHNTLDHSTKLDFELSEDQYVGHPQWYPIPTTIDGITYDGYYVSRVTIPNPQSNLRYFLFIKLEGNDPGGTGAQLNVRNGVTGGVTVDAPFGDKIIQIKGGLVKGYTNVVQQISN